MIYKNNNIQMNFTDTPKNGFTGTTLFDLILGVIQWGFSNNIYTGYHYIKESKSDSALKIYNYYRPLNVQTCLEAGYEIPSFRVKDFILRSILTIT
jgi:hypothetical protein